MDNSQYEKASEWLKNATADDITKVAEKMAESGQFPVMLSKQERDGIAQKMIEKGFFTQAEYDEVAREEGGENG